MKGDRKWAKHHTGHIMAAKQLSTFLKVTTGAAMKLWAPSVSVQVITEIRCIDIEFRNCKVKGECSVIPIDAFLA